MDGDHRPQQGDEARLFALYNDELMRRIRRAVRTSPEVVEDACSLAWAQFLRYQPPRDRNWRGWLFRTAEREAWTLDRKRYELKSLDAGHDESGWSPFEPAEQRDRYQERDELEAAVDVLQHLPPRLRRIAFYRAVGLHYNEIHEMTGDSRTRLSQLIRRANDHIHEALAELDDRQPSSPRAQRLHELESDPPRWLTAEIGRPPRSHGGRNAIATRLLAWRRAALAIDDYRAQSGFNAEDRALGDRADHEPSVPAHDAARRAIDALDQSRCASRDIGR